jgi:hypothetical protein
MHAQRALAPEEASRHERHLARNERVLLVTDLDLWRMGNEWAMVLNEAQGEGSAKRQIQSLI